MVLGSGLFCTFLEEELVCRVEGHERGLVQIEPSNLFGCAAWLSLYCGPTPALSTVFSNSPGLMKRGGQADSCVSLDSTVVVGLTMLSHSVWSTGGAEATNVYLIPVRY